MRGSLKNLATCFYMSVLGVLDTGQSINAIHFKENPG